MPYVTCSAPVSSQLLESDDGDDEIWQPLYPIRDGLWAFFKRNFITQVSAPLPGFITVPIPLDKSRLPLAAMMTCCAKLSPILSWLLA